MALTVGATFALRIPGFVHRLFDPDEAAIAVQGMALIRGGHLYTDVIDRKPPLAAWLYVGVFRVTGTHDLRPVRVVAAMLVVGAALLLASELLRRHDRVVAAWGTALFVAGSVAFAPQDAQAANFSPLALLPGVAAIVVARRGSVRSALGAGVCVGLATLTRQSWAIGVFPAMFAAWYAAAGSEGFEPGAISRTRRAALCAAPAELGTAVRTRGWSPAGHAASVAFGALVTVAAVGLTVPLRLFAIWVFTGNGSLLFGLSESRGVVVRALGSLALFAVGHLILVGLLAVRGWRPEVRGRWEDADLWLWLVVGLVSVVAGLRFFGHYWLQVLPPLCLLAAPVVARCAPSVRRLLGAVLACTTAVFAGLALVPGRLHPLPNPQPLARFVDAHSTSSDRIAIWGSYPELYWTADRMPAGGLVHTDFVVGKSAGRIESAATVRDADPDVVHDYVGALWISLPRLFIDTSTAGLRGYGAYPVTVLPDLERLLRTRYRVLGVVDGVTVYERVGPAAPPPEWLRD